MKKQIYIDGQWTDATGNEWIEVENPATREIIGKVPASQKEDVDRAVAGAKKAFESWAATPVEERAALLEKAVDWMWERKEEIAKIITSELGCPIKAASSTHTDPYLEEARGILDLARNYSFTEKKDGYELWKEPVGVVACLTPWNYPLGQITQKIFPALVTGNVVLLKPSGQTPLVAYKITEALHAAGLPAGVFQLITGKGSQVGNLFAEHPGIDMVTFTGSTAAGKKVAARAGDDVKRVILELGGKSPALVLEGADLSVAVKKTLNTVLGNVGQTCSAFTRLIAPRSMKQDVEDALLERLKVYKVGDPLDPETTVGPLQSHKQYEKVRKYIQLGLDEGARMIAGEVPEKDGAYFVQPVIFTEVRNDMQIAQDEIFGPVLCVIYYDDVEEGIQIANDTVYGLASGVFGPADQARGIARRLRAGNCTINRGSSGDGAPFGGYKHSGYGREGGIYGMEEFLELKAVFVE